jgi:Rieske Fe-S protein
MVTCGLCMMGMPEWLAGCAGTTYLAAPIEGDSLVVPLQSFINETQTDKKFKKYVVVSNEKLEYPICVYRLSDNNYQALLMRCTHQGTELQVFGDRLQCPAHGSEFSNTGAVQNGPADSPLRTFPIAIVGESLKIKLS